MIALIRQNINKYREQILYLVFGFAATIVNWVVYVLSLLLFSLVVSNSIAWLAAVTFAFFTNKIYIFRSKKTTLTAALKEFFLFFSARILSGVFEIGGLPLLVYLGLNQTIFGIKGAAAKALISVIVIVLNYFFSKYVIFRKPH